MIIMTLNVYVVTCCLVGYVWNTLAESQMNVRPSVLDSKCNPYVDMIFVLDQTPNVSQANIEIQRKFVHLLLKDHKAPKQAVRVAVMMCGNNYTRMGPFTDDISSSSALFPADAKLYETDTSRHCLDNLNSQFKSSSRDGVARQAVLLKSSWEWDLDRAKLLATRAKEERTVLVVIAMGIRDFDSLSALQVLATGEATYFVLPSFQRLGDLALVLAKDKCKPISLDLTSETKDVIPRSTTETPAYREPCVKLSPSTFQRHVPGLGYIRHTCTAKQTLDIIACKCV